MALQEGIVGLPNVGKSTLFNALTAAGAESANYPFCTIEPNTGVVPVHDERLAPHHERHHAPGEPGLVIKLENRFRFSIFFMFMNVLILLRALY